MYTSVVKEKKYLSFPSFFPKFGLRRERESNRKTDLVNVDACSSVRFSHGINAKSIFVHGLFEAKKDEKNLFWDSSCEGK